MHVFKKYFLSAYEGVSLKTWIIVSASFINAVGSAILIFIALYLSNVLHFSVDKISSVVSAYGLGLVIGSYVGGNLCDHFNPYKMSIFLLFSSGIATLLLLFFSQFYMLLLLLLLNGCFYGAFKPANTLILLYDSPQDDRAKLNGLYRVSINLGMGLASLIGSVLVMYSYQAIFLFDGLTSCLAAALLIYFHSSFAGQTIKHIKNMNQGSMGLFSDKIILALCFLLLLNCLVFFQIRTTYPLYLNVHYSISASHFSYIFLINCLMIVFLEVPILNAVKTYNQIIVSAVGSILLCLSMFLLAFFSNIKMAIVLCILFTTGEILLFSTVLSLIFNRATEASRGKFLGLYQSMFSLAVMLGPAIGGFLYNINPVLVWYGCGLIGLCSLCGFYLMSIREDKVSELGVA